MTTYADVTGTASYTRSKFSPHDKTYVRIVKNRHNAAATSIADDVVVNMYTIPAGSVILGCWTRVIVSDSSTAASIDVGLAGGVEYGANIDSNAANSTIIAAQCVSNPHYCQAANQITLTGNATSLAVGTMEIITAYIEPDNYGSAG